MVFSSLIFIFVFLPLFLLGYYLLPNKWRNLYIVLGGYFFYSWGAPQFAIILFSTIAIDYYISLLIYRLPKPQKKYLLIFSVVMNLALLTYFKYSNFFVGQLNFLFDFLNLASLPWKEVILPIGISFTVFQELSYIIEVYRGRIKPAKTFIDFAAYLMLFPHLIAGPIVRYIDIAGQIRERIYNATGFYYGLRRFTFGLAKKVLIANQMSAVAEAMFHINTVNNLASPLAWLGIIAYSMQIYFDFSGYSDMAIGLAKMLGFDFLENFNRPYIAKNITEFWRRWHISLTTWMKEYLYIPLGGNRISVLRTYLNLWIVFFISGLWHGASWNFVLWGIFHGCLLVSERMFLLRWLQKIPVFLQVSFTFISVSLGWVLFRLENLDLAWKFYRHLFSFQDFFKPLNISMIEIINWKQLSVLVLAILIVFLPWSEIGNKIVKINTIVINRYYEFLRGLIIIFIFLLSIMELFNAQFNPFIYFRF
jgi:alginate O-acetyltransferase complex protein AlgI